MATAAPTAAPRATLQEQGRRPLRHARAGEDGHIQGDFVLTADVAMEGRDGSDGCGDGHS